MQQEAEAAAKEKKRTEEEEVQISEAKASTDNAQISVAADQKALDSCHGSTSTARRLLTIVFNLGEDDTCSEEEQALASSKQKLETVANQLQLRQSEVDAR